MTLGRGDHSSNHEESGVGPSLVAGAGDRSPRRPLAIALAITAAFLVVEVIGGLVTGSLALLADAGHMATDVVALALSLLAIWLARRPATPGRSFGFYRAEVLAATLNASSLLVISGFIFWEAFGRLGARRRSRPARCWPWQWRAWSPTRPRPGSWPGAGATITTSTPGAPSSTSSGTCSARSGPSSPRW